MQPWLTASSSMPFLFSRRHLGRRFRRSKDQTEKALLSFTASSSREYLKSLPPRESYCPLRMFSRSATDFGLKSLLEYGRAFLERKLYTPMLLRANKGSNLRPLWVTIFVTKLQIEVYFQYLLSFYHFQGLSKFGQGSR